MGDNSDIQNQSMMYGSRLTENIETKKMLLGELVILEFGKHLRILLDKHEENERKKFEKLQAQLKMKKSIGGKTLKNLEQEDPNKKSLRDQIFDFPKPTRKPSMTQINTTEDVQPKPALGKINMAGSTTRIVLRSQFGISENVVEIPAKKELYITKALKEFLAVKEQYIIWAKQLENQVKQQGDDGQKVNDFEVPSLKVEAQKDENSETEKQIKENTW